MKFKSEYFAYLITMVSIGATIFVSLKASNLIKNNGNPNNCDLIEETISIESRVSDIKFQAYPLLDEFGNQVDFYSVLKQKKKNVVVLSAMEDCNACRDLELERWSNYATMHPEANTFLIILDKTDSKMKMSENFGLGRALSTGMTIFFDYEGSILNDLSLAPKETPIVFLVNQRGETLLVYKGDYKTQYRSDRFLEIFDKYEVNQCE